MRFSTLLLLSGALLSAGCTSTNETESASPRARASAGQPPPAALDRIHWEPWSDAIFDRARREGRFVLLDLEAVWCHWCHVMEETTYADPAVIRWVNEHYIAVKVDQDSRPDLSNRYEDYGWPATIVFDAAGGEIIKRSGYIPPAEFAATLAAIVADPTPGPSVGPRRDVEYSASSAVSNELRSELELSLIEAYDSKLGGFGFTHKYLDAPSVEYCIVRGGKGDAELDKMARQTLDAALQLINPAWGGVYQYSAGGVWTEPHFEKIMSVQADALQSYALAYSSYHDERYLQAARAIQRYLREFLTSPQGSFYTSQDADLVQGEHAGEYFALPDAARRKLGTPRIDTHVYARENGWAARALVALYAVSGDESALAEARRAVEQVVADRSLPGGGFRHDAHDQAGPYLGDTLAMAQAFVALYGATGERGWLSKAEEASKFMAANFAVSESVAAFDTVRRARGGVSPLAAQGPQREENVAVSRLEIRLYHYTGDRGHLALAERAMRFVATPAVAKLPFTSGPLLADRELTREPMHITIVGSKSDPRAKLLMRAAIAYLLEYSRIEWWDPKEGPLPNADVEYPELDRPAAFACAGGRCSSPAFAPEDVKKRVDALGR